MPHTAAVEALAADLHSAQELLRQAISEVPNIERRMLDQQLATSKDHAADLRKVESAIAVTTTDIALVKKTLEDHGKHLNEARIAVAAAFKRLDGLEREIETRKPHAPRFLWSNVLAVLLGSISIGFPFFRLYLKLPFDESAMWTGCFLGASLALFLKDPTRPVNFSIAGFLSEITGKKGK